MRVQIIKTSKYFWHKNMLGEIIDVKQSAHISNAYVLLNTKHNQEMFVRVGASEYLEALQRDGRSISKGYTKVVPATNQEAIVFLHE